MKNIASGTNHTNTMIDVDRLNNYFANVGKIFISGSNVSNLGDKNIPESVEKTIFLYPTDENEVYSLIKNCKTTNLSGLNGLSNNLLNIAGPVISYFLAVVFTRCFQIGYFPNILKIGKLKPLFDKQNPKNYPPFLLSSSLSKFFEKILVKRREAFWGKM